MKTAGKVALGIGAALGVLAAVLVVRTATWEPQSAEAPAVDLAAPVPVDGARAAVRLGEAIRFQTVSHQDEALNRREEWDRLHAWLEATYPKAHVAMTRETVAGRTLIYAWPGSDPAAAPIVLMAHQDVVPIEPGTEGAWSQAPFSGVLADGFVWGRGAIDDKGSMVALMEAAEALAERGFRPARTIYFVFGHDEEVGGTGAMAAAGWFKARGVRPEFVLDEGMLAITEAPLSKKPLALIGVAEKGYATLKVTARGDGGHSSAPPDRTAVHVLAQAVDRIASDPFEPRLDGPGADTLRAAAADAPWLMRMLVANSWLFGPLIADQAAAVPVGASMLRTSIAPTMLQGSAKENVLPQTASALINYRIHPRDSLDSVMARAKRAVGDLPVELEWTAGAEGPSGVSGTDSRAWAILAAAAREATGARPAAGLMTGATDGRRMAGVAEAVYRFQPILLAPEDLERFHGTNERVSVENLDRAAEFYARVIATAAG